MKTYLVGGAVRDGLLGRPVDERDWVVVGATVEQMLAAGYRQVGRDFPVFLHPQTREEYALARTERKSGPGYRGFVVHAAPDVTLEEDLRRRDLTINAMARDADGALIDPFGGRADLERGVLRHVSDAFAEDPVRVLRLARFAARFDFAVAPETEALMRAMVRAGEVDALVAERVWQELARALLEPHPQRFFEVLRRCGALARILPEVDRLWGVPQPPQHHPEIDCGVHTLMVLAQAARLGADGPVRFAALTHDLGKGTTDPEQWPRHVGHESRSVTLIDEMCGRLRAPREYRDLAVAVARWHSHAHRALQLKPDTVLRVLEGLDAFRRPERFEQFLLACTADIRGRTGYEDDPYPQARYLRAALDAANSVSGAALARQGLAGEALAKTLRSERLARVKSVPQPASGD